MNKSQNRKTKRKFTLIELLVVISIIALLVALLLPAIGAVRRQAKNVQAKSLANAIVIAIKQYETTYGLLPVASGDVTSASNEKLTGSYENLIALLSKIDYPGVSGSADTGNPRGTRFLDVPPKYDSDGYLDPWGNKFVIGVDANYDHKVKGLVPTDLNGTVFIYSFGQDGKDDQGSKDDVITWK